MISSASFSDILESSCPATDHASQAATALPETMHDTELVRRFNTGDEDAFVEIVSRHREKMFCVALGHLRNHADAEEITQDVFIHAYRGLARFRGDSSLSTWLHCIAFNLSRNRYGYYFRRHRHETGSFDCTLSDDNSATFADLIASDGPDPARAAANHEFLEHVAVCLGKLNAHQREILTLRNHLDHSYEEIAASLGISLGTVKSRLARAREALRTLLDQMYGECEPGTSSPFLWFEPNRPFGHFKVACG